MRGEAEDSSPPVRIVLGTLRCQFSQTERSVDARWPESVVAVNQIGLTNVKSSEFFLTNFPGGLSVSSNLGIETDPSLLNPMSSL